MPEIEMIDTNLFLRDFIAKINFLMYDIIKKLSTLIPFLKRA